MSGVTGNNESAIAPMPIARLSALRVLLNYVATGLLLQTLAWS